MKKIYKLICLMFFSVAAVCMFSSFSAPSKKIAVEGYIKVYSNEPFTFLGIETADGKQYKLIHKDEDKTELSELQGYKVLIEGTLKKNSSSKKLATDMLKDGSITVDSYSVIE